MDHRTRQKATQDVVWSEGEIARLREMRRDGTSTRLISLELNRTVRAIEAMDLRLRMERLRGR